MLKTSRVFESKRRIRVADCDSRGKLRVDAIARYLQDIGYDDTEDIGVGDGGLWVARSIEMDFSGITKWPNRNEFIGLSTFCSGIGHAFAQRCVDIKSKSNESIRTLTVWVSIDERGKPTQVPSWLAQAYPFAEKIKSKRTLEVIDPQQEFDGTIVDWPLRASDLDINNHANNSVAFDALYESAQIMDVKQPKQVRIEYHHPLGVGDNTNIFMRQSDFGFEAWLTNRKNVAASMSWISK